MKPRMSKATSLKPQNVPPIIGDMIEKLQLPSIEAQNAYQSLWAVKDRVDKALHEYTLAHEKKVQEQRARAEKVKKKHA